MLRSFHRYERDLLLVNNLIKLNIIVILYKESQDISLKKYSDSKALLPSNYFYSLIINFSDNTIIEKKIKDMLEYKVKEAISKKKFMNRSEAEILNKAKNTKQKNQFKKLTHTKKPISIQPISSSKLSDDFYQHLSTKSGFGYFLHDSSVGLNSKFFFEMSKFTNSQVKYDSVVRKEKPIKNEVTKDFKLEILSANIDGDNNKRSRSNNMFKSNYDDTKKQRYSELNLGGTIERFTAHQLSNKLNKYDYNNSVADSLRKDMERSNVMSKVLAIKLERKNREINYDNKIREMNRTTQEINYNKIMKDPLNIINNTISSRTNKEGFIGISNNSNSKKYSNRLSSNLGNQKIIKYSTNDTNINRNIFNKTFNYNSNSNQKLLSLDDRDRLISNRSKAKNLINKKRVNSNPEENKLTEDSYLSGDELNNSSIIMENGQQEFLQKLNQRINKEAQNSAEYFKRSNKLAQLQVKYLKMMRQKKEINYNEFQLRLNSTKKEL